MKVVMVTEAMRGRVRGRDGEGDTNDITDESGPSNGSWEELDPKNRTNSCYDSSVPPT